MDVSYLLDSLNDKQREAVAASRTNMLVLAGAGSGKTRVLVHRIAWLLSVENCSPYSIMAVTFTNKAAAEMRHRIGQLMGTTQGGMWVGHLPRPGAPPAACAPSGCPTCRRTSKSSTAKTSCVC
ncbi:DNA-dependent helicase II [Klebsiella pneumoniae]|uniref:DNA 3'-5' helicase II n=1 Tax=Klebsiella pneumoniae TaxID=573 RepID=A0A377XIK5_KLEPN|nr:DNA-dependent helicase II [Klebsiella pneumoniae]